MLLSCTYGHLRRPLWPISFFSIASADRKDNKASWTLELAPYIRRWSHGGLSLCGSSAPCLCMHAVCHNFIFLRAFRTSAALLKLKSHWSTAMLYQWARNSPKLTALTASLLKWWKQSNKEEIQRGAWSGCGIMYLLYHLYKTEQWWSCLYLFIYILVCAVQLCYLLDRRRIEEEV